jgi:serine/threonine protein kinase
MSEVFGNKIGQYILLEKLGEGGMAKVYNAFDARAENNVAIKVILPSKRSSQVFLQQFEMEAKALANLTHTNIVKVLNYGVEDDQPYLVMEFVPGGTLKEALSKPLPWQTAAGILAPIARALEYVHQQNIVHRDVKPANILLQEDYRPMLSDFGILKLLETKNENVNSAIGVGVGTPEYMPPEQGLGKEVDFRADIYSLGLVFYEMVTGQKPFTADTPMAMVIKHVTDEIPLPTALNNKIPKFVEQAIMRAVQKDPEKRYASMGQFADVLELVALGDQAPTKRIVKLAQRKERRKLPLVWLLFVLLVLAGVSIFAYQAYYATPVQPVDLPTTTHVATATIEAPKPTATLTASIQDTPMPRATETVAIVPTPRSVINSSTGVTLLGTPFTFNQSSSKEVARWGIGGVNVVAWSPDGNTIILGTTSGIFMYDAQSRGLIRFIDTQFDVMVMVTSPDGSQIAAGSSNSQLGIWDAKTGQSLREFRYVPPASTRPLGSSPVTAIAFAPNGKTLAAGYKNGSINYFSVDQGSPSLSVEQYPTVSDLAISGDNRFIYVSNGENDLQVWDIASKKQIRTMHNPAPVSRIKLSADRQLLLCAGNGNSVYIWDTFAEKLFNSFPNLGSAPTDFDFSSDGKLVVIGLADGSLKIFETPDPANPSKTLTPIKKIEKAYIEKIRSVAFSPTQALIAAGNWEEGLKLFDTQSDAPIATLGGSMRGITALYFSKDGAWLATAHSGNVVRLWNVGKAQEAGEYQGYLPKGNPFSPDNRFLAIPHTRDRYSESIQIVELNTRKVVAELPKYEPKTFVQFSADSKILVLGDSYAATIWDTATWEQINTHGGPNAGCGQYYTPQGDSERLAVISDAGILFTYTPNIIDMCGTKPKGATFMFYFPTQNKLVFVLGNGRIWIGNNKSGDINNIQSAEPYRLSDNVFLAGDQTGGWYAYVENDKVKINNTTSYNSLLTIPAQDDYQYRAAFLPGTKLLALGSRYGSIHFWTLP